MQRYLDQVTDLTDNQSSINNYAEPSLHLASKVRNRSKQFATKLTTQHPVVQNFLAGVRKPEVDLTAEEALKNLVSALHSVKKPGQSNVGPNKENELERNPKLEVFLKSDPAPKVEPPERVGDQVPKFEPAKPKFGNPFSGPPVRRPTFRPSNFGEPAQAPKFGLPGLGSRPSFPGPAAPQPRFTNVQRQGSFGKSDDFSSNGEHSYVI